MLFLVPSVRKCLNQLAIASGQRWVVSRLRAIAGGRSQWSIPLLQPSDLEILQHGFQLNYCIDVTLEIQEDLEGRGSFTVAAVDKDCFKLHHNAQKQLVLSLAQPNTNKPLVVDKLVPREEGCCGGCMTV